MAATARKHRHWHKFIGLMAGLVLAVLLGAAGGAVILLSGVYSTAATRQHFAVTHWLLEKGLRFSVGNATGEIATPSLDGSTLVKRGLACFTQHCVQCHGAPGEAPQGYALGMLPVPTNLAQSSRDWQPVELYWLISKGIRMTGMPAWEYRLSTESRWATVAFLRTLPSLSRSQYHDLAREAAGWPCPSATDMNDVAPEEDSDPDPRRVVIRQYACIACHRIEGVVGPPVDVGPPLENWSTRRYIAGVMPNTPENLVRWIRDPQAASPGTLMPDLDVSEAHAREIASFIFMPESR
jgi:mono/diheme cytochrome c family protein